MLLLPTLALQAATAGPPRAGIPPDVQLSSLLSLTSDGEVGLLPQHDLQPFNAVIVTRSADRCEEVARSMMDVESYPSRFNIKRARILERTATAISYELELRIVFAPRVPGHVSRTAHDRVVYDDLETGAKFIWSLHDVPSGCAMTYSMLETPGKASGWVGVIRTLEASAVDAANFAAGLSSSRGFTKPEDGRVTTTNPEADRAFFELARHGTALRVQRAQGRFPIVVTRRVIDARIDDVRAAIEARQSYRDKLDVVRSVRERGDNVTYDIGAFGGRVAWQTSVETGADPRSGNVLVRERVTGGDLPAGAGGWSWRLRPVAGGTDVELTWNLDVTAGSAVLSTLARTDPIASESLALHMALSLMGRVVGGKPLGPATLAHMP